ncbi:MULTISPECIES: hypothetical protein [unclassified Streptomyces]|uniref:hypothetical protein n=1 Tax=unclassified Streptomyces TaxID=2593676 RepID=UPI00081F6D89|nr:MULTISPECIES: hypothetical protein [unclassified Streptomyces]MYZ38435.1 hypothetical protein [Streptomyces sp. SID4917]SCF98453.1 hypothetical protein GA0115259_106347 [Streptomyces sp. MnatMP-M17]
MDTLDIASQTPSSAHAVPQPDRVEVPRNFTFAGKTLRGRRITDGQAIAIQLAKDDGNEAVLSATRTVIRSAVGEANWKWMNEQLLVGAVEFAEFVNVISQLSGTGDA